MNGHVVRFTSEIIPQIFHQLKLFRGAEIKN
jgi:hypothetical protein